MAFTWKKFLENFKILCSDIINIVNYLVNSKIGCTFAPVNFNLQKFFHSSRTP